MKNYTCFVLCIIFALTCTTPLISHAVELTNDDFEAGFGNWSNVSGDQGDWVRRQGSTPSTSTGPNHDNTIGAAGYYLHMEATDLAENDVIYLESLDYDADTYDISLEFYYHMYGNAMGTLNVDVYNGSWNLGVWSISSQQHTSSSAIYTKQVVDLSSYTGTIKIRFRGVDYNSYTGDMSIDDVIVHGTATGGGGSFLTPYTMDMEELEVMASYWIQVGCGICGGVDYSGDGDIDLEDFAILAAQWLISYEPPTTTTTTAATTTTTTAAGSLPALIEAEDYTSMNGIDTETCSEGGLNVGWIDAGDWMEYADWSTGGTYTVDYRVASELGGGQLRLELDGGATQFPTLSVPGTGGWQDWTTISQTVTLPSGIHDIRIYVLAGGWNINWFEFTSGTTTTTTAATTTTTAATTTTTAATTTTTAIPQNPLVINEFMASNNAAYPDPYGDFNDWIEIYNGDTVSINIGGMYLTDNLAVPTKWRVPTDNSAATTISAGGYLIIWADDTPSKGTLHATFKLSAGGEEIGLFQSNGITLIDSITFGEQVTDISYGRYPDASSVLRFFATPTPLLPNSGAYLGFVDDTNFSYGRGFYDSSFYLGISCDTTGATIYYTTDGSEPTESSSPYSSPITIDSTTCIRAKAFKTGWMPTNIDTQTYIFLADVITQDSTPAGWPTGPINGQEIDYGMDLDVVYDGDYIGLVDDALLAVPTISLVTDLDNLFDPSAGIYVNAEEHGELWERPTSVELLNPDGSEGFQVEAGLRIRGGWSRRDDNPKHAFRLFFRTDYGDSELDYPMFENEGVDKFEKLDLRTAQNYSWSFKSGEGVHNTMLREVFSRDTQGQMGHPYTRSRYYHLYINGQYWGLYQSEERPEARYAASYFGGTAEDYDVVKPIGYPEPGAYTIEATDGTLDTYEDLWDAATAGFASDSAYYQVQGLNTDGTRNPAYPVQLDVDNLIDFMLNTFYVGDIDAPITMWHSGINNFYAIYNRTNPDGWKFFRHDAEHSLFAHVPGFDPTYVGYNATIDVTGPWGLFSDFPRFNPRWLHERLTANANYRMRFADRTCKHFFNDGPFVASTAVATITARKNQIDSAIIAESARWGDSKTHPPRTRNDDWLPTVNTLISDFFPTRVSVVLGQIRDDGWYPNTDPPTYNQQGGYVSSGFGLTMYNPNGSGTIYYTLNGSDPQTGTVYSGSVTLTKSTQVKARVLDGGEWSAVNETIFAIGPVAEKLRITEIMYHPQDTGNPQDPNEEYIELKNTGTTALNLNLVALTNGVYFTFPDMSLAAGDYVLVVKDMAAFEAKYGGGKNIAGEYTGSLSNGGERIELDDAIGTEILDFDYKDGWRDITDGDGFSLTIINASNPDITSWDLKASWRASAYKGGSPDVGDDGIIPNPGDVAINEVLAHAGTIPYDWIELHNTTGSSINISGWYLSDDDSDETTLKKSQIAPATSIPGNGYIVFYQNTHFTEFGLSENGETLCLSSADGGGALTGFRKKEDFGASQADIAFGRYQKTDGSFNFVAMSSNTAGSVNAYPKVGPIVINEIMYNPDSGNQNEEYIELRNISGSAVTLYDSGTSEPWKFTDGIEFTFPSGSPVTIPAGGYLMVVKDLAAFAIYGSMGGVDVLGPYEGYLSNGGEKVEISMPGDVDGGVRQYIRVDRVNYSDGSHPVGVDPWPTEPDGNGNFSLTRKVSSNYGNDEDNWESDTPSPGVP